MAAKPGVHIDVDLPFPRAGVAFTIRVETPSDGRPPSFHLTVTDLAKERNVPFTVAGSPQLADWVRGYTRWLVRANVAASYDEQAITGSFAADLTPERVLQGVKDACDMIRQRFDAYDESVLA